MPTTSRALLGDLLRDRDRRRRMGEASRARFQAEFTWTKIGGEYEQALRAALARHGHAQEKIGVSA